MAKPLICNDSKINVLYVKTPLIKTVNVKVSRIFFRGGGGRLSFAPLNFVILSAQILRAPYHLYTYY